MTTPLFSRNWGRFYVKNYCGKYTKIKKKTVKNPDIYKVEKE